MCAIHESCSCHLSSEVLKYDNGLMNNVKQLEYGTSLTLNDCLKHVSE
jgi:hypothetical protein